MALGCEYYHNSGSQPAFEFFQPRANGTMGIAQPRPDASGLCYFPEASCESAGRCCYLTPAVKASATHAGNLNTAACGLVLLALVAFHRLRKRLQARARTAEVEAGAEESSSSSEGASQEQGRCRLSMALSWLSFGAFGVILGAEVYVMTLVATMTQQLLSVPARNSMLAGDAFLVPVAEIFQFVEDVVAVKISAAIGRGDRHLVRPTLLLGVLGGALCGSLAALLVTGICSWPAGVQWLLAPYTFHDSSLDCPLVPQGPAAAQLAHTYLLLQAWSWPASFAMRGVRGFFLATGDYLGGFVLLGLVSNGVIIAGVYSYFVADSTLHTLGWIYFVSNWASLLFLLVLFALRVDLRRRYDLLIFRAKTEETQQVAVPLSEVLKDSMREGLLAMVLDVSAQASVTVGIYTAGTRLGLGAMYQISALQAAFPQYGLAWIWGITYTLRLQGAELVFRRAYAQFQALFGFIQLFAFGVLIASACTLFPFANPIAFLQAAQGCEYASRTSCLEIYGSIFGGGGAVGGDLQETFRAWFLPVLAARSFYQLFKAGLYACHDWLFMARVGAGALLLVFLPAAVVVNVLFCTPAALFVTMYLPWAVMTAAFMMRTRHNIKKMLAEETGPWLQDAKAHADQVA